MKQAVTKMSKCFLPMLFIAYIGCISLFTHSHVVNGVTIVHSHPYKDDAQHSHTTSQFQLIYLLSHMQVADGAVTFLTIGVYLVLLCSIIVIFRKDNYRSPAWGTSSLRAPPFRG